MIKTEKPLSSEGLNPAEKDEFLKTAGKRVDQAYTHWKDNFINGEKKLRFLYGQQWAHADIQERELSERPFLTLNVLPQYVDQVIGAQKQSKLNIHVSPAQTDLVQVGTDMEEEGKLTDLKGVDIKRSKVYEGVIRQIEYQSTATTHYDRAFKHAVETGFGWLRVLTTYLTDDSFDQDILIKSLKNRFSVLIDPGASEPDYSDARWGFIFDQIHNDDFEEEYPEKLKGEFIQNTQGFRWISEYTTKIAEYFYKVPKNRVLLLMVHEDGSDITVWKDEIVTKRGKMPAKYSPEKGWNILKQKTVETSTWKWCKITARDILEQPRDWAGKYLPIVPVFGKEAILTDKSKYMGVTEHSEDAQRFFNMMITSAAESVGTSPNAQWLTEEDAIEGLESIWADANRSTTVVLPYKTGKQKPDRVEPARMPAAEIQLALMAKDFIKSTIGRYDAGVGAESNETSGRAILARKTTSDTGDYEYTDNLAIAINHIGRILVDLIPKIFDGGRIIRILNPDSSGQWFKINQLEKGEDYTRENEHYVVVNDLTIGKYDIRVRAGAGYQTLREEAVAAMLNFIQVMPDTAQVFGDVIAENMDWPGADIIAERLKKIMPPNLLSADEREELGLDDPENQPPPDPNQVLKTKEEEAKVQGKQVDLQIEQEQNRGKEIELEKLRVELNSIDPETITRLVTQVAERIIAEKVDNAGQTK